MYCLHCTSSTLPVDRKQLPVVAHQRYRRADRRLYVTLADLTAGDSIIRDAGQEKFW